MIDLLKIVEKYINWEADIKTLYHKKNNGCMKGVSSAINWFFDNEDEGIILEDDCVPHPDFFPFCTFLRPFETCPQVSLGFFG